MAIYDLGTASLAANGEVTGVGTAWKAPLTLIRVGATIVFKTEPVQIYTISEIISDTQVNVYNPNSETAPAGTGYAILANDGITVQGLAQDVAETLRYYQSRETEVAGAVDAFNNFNAADFESKVTQVNDKYGDIVTIAGQVSIDASQASSDAISSQINANNASSAAYRAEAAANALSGSLTLNFSDGGTVESKNQQVLYINGGDVESYVWTGSFPKTIPAGSTPDSTGGVELGAWVILGDSSLRSELISEKGPTLIGNSQIVFDNLNSALNFSSFKLGKQLMIKGYNSPGDGGESFFVVVPYSESVGIPTTDSAFKLKRTSGHDYLLRIMRNGKTPRIVAHRGWHGVTPNEYSGALSSPVYFVPENTRASIAFSAERGAFGVEGDTKITSDGVPVIFHDETVNRTTNGTGNVTSFTLAGLKALDAGSYVSDIYADEKILTYPEWLFECKRNGVMPFAEWSAPMTPSQADDFLAAVNKYYGPKPVDVFLYSTYPPILELLRSKNAYIGLGIIGSYGSALTTAQLDLAYKLGNCAGTLTGGSITNQTAVDGIKSRGLPFVYAIANTPAVVDNCASAGCDVVITDFYRG